MANKRQRKKRHNNGILQTNDVKEYNRLKKNTLSKVKRVKQNYGLNLTHEISIPKPHEFTSRKTFNEWKQEMKDFTNRSNLEYQFERNKYGVVASKSLLEEMRLNTKLAQQNVEKLYDEYKDKPYVIDRKTQSTVGQQFMMTGHQTLAGIVKPLDFDFDKIQSTQRLYKRAESLREKASGNHYTTMKEVMQENFVDKLRKMFNSMGDALANKIDDMSPDDFFDMYLYFEELDFDYLYEQEEYGNENTFGELLDTIEDYVDSYKIGGADSILRNYPPR